MEGTGCYACLPLIRGRSGTSYMQRRQPPRRRGRPSHNTLLNCSPSFNTQLFCPNTHNDSQSVCNIYKLLDTRDPAPPLRITRLVRSGTVWAHWILPRSFFVSNVTFVPLEKDRRHTPFAFVALLKGAPRGKSYRGSHVVLVAPPLNVSSQLPQR